jgi:DNA-binding NarL/FixJ family response regulator
MNWLEQEVLCHRWPLRPLRVLLAVDSRLFAEALMFTLDSDPRIEAIGYARDGAETIDLVASLTPDALIVGERPGGIDQVDLCRWIHELHPGVSVVLLRDRLVPLDIETAYAAGAADCLPTSCSADELLHAIGAADARRLAFERGRLAAARREATHRLPATAASDE